MNILQYKRFILPLISFGFIAWVIYLANTGQSSLFFDLVKLIPFGDKVGHFCLFGLLTLTTNYGLKYKHIGSNKSVLMGTIFVAILVLLEECSQSFIPSRTFDFIDLTADTLGILIFHFIALKLKQKRKKINKFESPN